MLGIFGNIKNPLGDAFPDAKPYASVKEGLPLLIGNLVSLIAIVAGIWMTFNLVIAGFTYITSSGNQEQLNKAWAMIWQSLVGLIIIIITFTITAIISKFLFGDYTTILKPTIFGPGSL